MSESKRDRFIRIAESRTNRTLECIRLLGNCSKKANYNYNDEDVKKIFGIIEKELKSVKNMFLGLETKGEKFTLR